MKEQKLRFYFCDVQYGSVKGSEDRRRFAGDIVLSISKWKEEIRNGSPIQYEVNRYKLALFKIKDTDDGIYIFHFLRYEAVKNLDIMGLETYTIAKMKDIISIKEDHAMISHCVCAYDEKYNVIILQDSSKISLSAISKFMTIAMQKDIKITRLAGRDSISELPNLDLTEVDLHVGIRDIYSLTNSIIHDPPPLEKMEIYSELKKIFEETGAAFIEMKIKSDKDQKLEENVVIKAASYIQKMFSLNPKKIKMLVSGSVKTENLQNKTDMGELRVIDICKNLLCVEETCKMSEDSSIKDNFPLIEEVIIKAIKSGRLTMDN